MGSQSPTSVAVSEWFSGGGLPPFARMCRWLRMGPSFTGWEGSGCPGLMMGYALLMCMSRKSGWPGSWDRVKPRSQQQSFSGTRHLPNSKPYFTQMNIFPLKAELDGGALTCQGGAASMAGHSPIQTPGSTDDWISPGPPQAASPNRDCLSLV